MCIFMCFIVEKPDLHTYIDLGIHTTTRYNSFINFGVFSNNFKRFLNLSQLILI